MCDITTIYNRLERGINGVIKGYKPYLHGYVGEDDLWSATRIAIWNVLKKNPGMGPDDDLIIHHCVNAARNAIRRVMRDIMAEKRNEYRTVRCDLLFENVVSVDDIYEAVIATEMKDIVREKLLSRPLIYVILYDQLLNPSIELVEMIHEKCRRSRDKEAMPDVPTFRVLGEFLGINPMAVHRIVSIIRVEFTALLRRQHA